eukprot:g4505.t1
MVVTQKRALLEGEEVEIFKIVSKAATAKQWAEWLRVPLEHAAASGDFGLVDRLLLAGANGSAGWRGCRRRTLLDAAALGGNDEVVSALLQAGCGPDVNNVSSSSRRSALYQSIVGKHEAAATRLIFAGADVNYVDPTDRATPLYAAAVTARQAGLVRALLIAGACPNVRCGDEHNYTPLHGAAERGLDKVVSALLGTPRTDKDAVDTQGQSALMLASRAGHLTTVETLLLAGADLDIRDSHDNESALDSAANKADVRLMELLLDHGADVNDFGCSESTLHGAALFDTKESVRVLVDAGAYLDRTNSGGTPLHCAARYGSNAALLQLLRAGADPNDMTFEGDTALHLAASGDNDNMDDTVNLLLRWGASEQDLDGEGKTTAERLQELKRERGGGTNDARAHRLARALELLASAPADRAWRRRSWLVMLRARTEKERMERRGDGFRAEGGDSSGEVVHDDRGREDNETRRQENARSEGRPRSRRRRDSTGFGGLVEVLLGLESDGVFRTILGFL